MGPARTAIYPLHLYNTLEDVLQSIRGFTKEHGYALTKLRSRKGKDGEANKQGAAIAANIVHLMYSTYRNKTGGESKAQDAVIVPSLGYWFVQKTLALASSKLTIVDTIIYLLQLQRIRQDELKTHFVSIQQLSVATQANQIYRLFGIITLKSRLSSAISITCDGI